MASGVYEFRAFLRVGAESKEQATQFAENIANELTDGPQDAQLSLDDSEPDFEGREPEPVSSVVRDTPCITRTYWGGQERVTFADFANEVVQDHETAVRIAMAMLADRDTPERDYNEGDHPRYYERFQVWDADGLREQIAKFETEA